MSPGAELKYCPELLTLTEKPVVVERVTLLAPAVTFHVVVGGAWGEVKVTEVAYPDGV
jgi:hypothetical protein